MKFTRTSYQQGCLTTETRKTGPDVWVYLWREPDAEGTRRLRKIVVGTVKEYRSESAAAKAVALLRADINRETGSGAFRPLSVSQLIAHYETNELDGARSTKANSTKLIYKSVLATWIKPFWGTRLLSEVKVQRQRYATSCLRCLHTLGGMSSRIATLSGKFARVQSGRASQTF